MSDRPQGPLWARLRMRPRLADWPAARRRLADIEAFAAPPLLDLLKRPLVLGLVAGIAEHSPFLWQSIAADPARLYRVLDDDPGARVAASLAALADGDDDEKSVMRRLRLARQEVSLTVALADIGGVWGLEEVLQALSRAGEAFIRTALEHLLRRSGAAGKFVQYDASVPSHGCGIAVLALGKLGGCELNYSSDVDLLIVFDPAAAVRRDEAQKLYVRLVQDLVRLLQQPTADGSVLRVDLRLRPDPGSTAVAISVDAAFRYYEAFGQNWERAALIKARLVAGDLALGQGFLDGLSPFLWRKYFDYAAIADIHAMKRQIHAVKGGGEIAVAGHNVKLGRGGIREIEFFVQTQQLVFGGKRPHLRGSRTLPMLRELRRDGWIGTHAAADLKRAYDFLRSVEHRLQMVADEQTHRLPPTPEGMERFARFFGFANAERFAAVLTRHLGAVAYHYALLFETEPGLDDLDGSLVFTGISDDPETLETLSRLGYAAPGTISRRVREWHSGRRLGVRSPRAREALTELVPKLLVTFARTFDPDAAVAAFDKALERMPAAAELFAILNANAALRTLFGEILGSAPRLADVVASRPHALDAAISPAAACLDTGEMVRRVGEVFAHAGSTEEWLDAARDFQQEEHFLIGVRLLSGDLDPDDAGRAYSALAIGIVRNVLQHLIDCFHAEHGQLAGSSVAILAMGKLGSREMTATSDLDLVLLYEFDAEDSQSDGPHPLHASRYFARLTQRLVTHLSAPTRRGTLYEVDMRLRPSGRQGPLATKLSAFATYQRAEAATWEHMALTRARVLAGDLDFGTRIRAEINGVLRRAPKPTLRADIADMRALVEREKPAAGAWDLKLLPGGLLDIEFLAQYLVLAHAADVPRIIDPSTQAILGQAVALKLVDAAIGARLLAAHRLYTNTLQIMRLALGDDGSLERAGPGVQRRLAASAGLPDFARLSGEIADARQAVREIFRTLLSDG